MIRRKHRFHGRGSLRFVYTRGATIRGSLANLKYILNDRRGEYRLAVVVSKKVSKSAVKRNRIRRRVYEVVRLEDEHITKPYDMVITVFQEKAASLPYDRLKGEVVELVKKAGIIP